MAPKAGLSQAQKLEKILVYFQQSQTCHTLKDLEQALPSAVSVHKMQVKDLIKELIDDNKIKVERIGSGNWYWSWAGEEAREKKNAIARLEEEKSTLDDSIATLQGRVQYLKDEQADAQGGSGHQDMIDAIASLEEEVQSLTSEKDAWENAVVGGVEVLRADTETSKGKVAESTDNIYILEGHLQNLVGGDREAMDAIRRESYGGYYVEEEGLPELALN